MIQNRREEDITDRSKEEGEMYIKLQKKIKLRKSSWLERGFTLHRRMEKLNLCYFNLS